MASRRGIREIDHGYNRIMSELKKAQGAYVKIGVQEGSKHRDSTGSQDLALIAAVHEYGLRGIPQRSFLFSTMMEKQNEINRLVQKELGEVVAGRKTVFAALSMLGLRVESMVKEKITKGPFTPLDKKTIERKKGSKPLIDTGQLRQSIRYVVMDAK